jgi:rare lipoprotein A (peptidoglycan hydrolase)
LDVRASDLATTAAPLILTGQATWYGTGPGRGHAAAGSELRTGDWRGRHVEVCHAGRCVGVVLDDWCACGGARIIDLSDEDFARLAPLSAGVISVTVTAGAGVTPVSPVPTAPATDVDGG